MLGYAIEHRLSCAGNLCQESAETELNKSKHLGLCVLGETPPGGRGGCARLAKSEAARISLCVGGQCCMHLLSCVGGSAETELRKVLGGYAS